jgi:hypothetical protein
MYTKAVGLWGLRPRIKNSRVNYAPGAVPLEPLLAGAHPLSALDLLLAVLPTITLMVTGALLVQPCKTTRSKTRCPDPRTKPLLLTHWLLWKWWNDLQTHLFSWQNNPLWPECRLHFDLCVQAISGTTSWTQWSSLTAKPSLQMQVPFLQYVSTVPHCSFFSQLPCRADPDTAAIRNVRISVFEPIMLGALLRAINLIYSECSVCSL